MNKNLLKKITENTNMAEKFFETYGDVLFAGMQFETAGQQMADAIKNNSLNNFIVAICGCNIKNFINVYFLDIVEIYMPVSVGDDKTPFEKTVENKKLKRIRESEYLSAILFNNFVNKNYYKAPAQAGVDMANAILKNSINDFVIAVTGESIESLIDSVLPSTKNNFFDLLERRPTNEMPQILYCLQAITEKTNKYSWLLNECGDPAIKNEKAMNIFSDINLSEIENLKDFVEEILEKINLLCEEEEKKAIKNRYLPEEYDYLYLYNKLPIIVKKILHYLFDTDIDENKEFFKVRINSLDEFEINFHSLSDCEHLYLNSSMNYQIFKVNRGYYKSL